MGVDYVNRLYHNADPNGQFNYEWLINKQIQKMLDRDIEKRKLIHKPVFK